MLEALLTGYAIGCTLVVHGWIAWQIGEMIARLLMRK